MVFAKSQESSVLRDHLYDDPSQLSQLLGQRAGSEAHFQFTISPDHHHHSPRDLTPRRDPTQSRHVKPSLPQHHTAPAPTGIVINLDGREKMVLSHNNAMDAPGDTQPDSQIYKEWTSGIFGSVSNHGPVPTSLLDPVEQDDADTPTEGIEIVESSQEQLQEQQSPTVTSPTVFQDDYLETRQRADALTSPLKFETPAMMRRKRDSPGQVLSSAFRTATTPRTILSASAFAFGTGIGNAGFGHAMSLTQAFDATQAGTSPAIGVPSEDPIFQRPSPNFTNACNSSPIPAISSPIKTVRSDPHLRSSSEPRVEYVKMKQSQEQRQRQRQRQRELQREDTTATEEQDSWEASTEAENRMRQRRAREEFEKEAGQSLARVSAPPLSSPRSAKKRGLLFMRPEHQTPAVRTESKRTSYDGFNESEDENGSINGLSQNELASENVSDDSLDELSQDIPSSIRPSRTLASAVKEKILVPNTSSHPQRTFSSRSLHNSSPIASPSLQKQHEPQFRAHASQVRVVSRLKSSRESVTIMDSQPDANVDIPSSMPRPKVFHMSSSPSANQYSINNTTITKSTGYTSQVISSSMPPRPPKYTSPRLDTALDEEELPEENEEGVPSSPPVVTHENNNDDNGDEYEVTYDEHAYDEHYGSEDEAEIELEQSSDPEVDMDMKSEIAESEHDAGGQENIELVNPVTCDAVDNDIDIIDHTEQEDLPESIDDKNSDIEPQIDLIVAPQNGIEMAENQTPPEFTHRDAPGIELKEDLSQSQHDDVVKAEDQEEFPEDNGVVQFSHPEEHSDGSAHKTTDQSRLQRQTTVPESDMLDVTQPSFFVPVDASDDKASQRVESAAAIRIALNQTNSTEPFHTAQEHQPASQSNDSSDVRESMSQIEQAPPFRSLNDIANQPDIQYSQRLGDIEYPKLSFSEDMTDELDANLSGSSPLRPAAKRLRTYGKKKKTFISPVKDAGHWSDQVPSSPLKQAQQIRDETPSSASMQEREREGAHAAEMAREEAVSARPATLKSSVRRQLAKLQPQRKGALKPVNKALLVRGLSKSPLNPKPSVSSRTKSPIQSPRRTKAQQDDVEMSDVNSAADDAEELIGPILRPIETIATVVDRGEAPTGPLVMPNRLFANWPGQGFYTATCLGRIDAHRVHVRFDEGSEGSLETIHVRSLDLRAGDQVKVDQMGMKKHVYIVVGFKNKIDGTEGHSYPQTDCHGYATVVLEEKQRDSLPRSKSGSKQKPTVSVPMGTLYLTNQMWSKFHDRAFTFAPSGFPSAPASRVATPTAVTNNLATPSMSMSRRGMAGPSFLKQSVNRAGSVASSTHISGTVFTNMVFAVTFTQDSSDKDAIAKLITSNGGQILEAGFQELFNDLDFEAPEGKGRETPPSDLILKQQYQHLRFVALISDAHSRRTKYIQALALNIPCLHIRWIQDSVLLSRPQTFGKYLLPAGLSTFLDPRGIVRSRTLHMYDPASEDLMFVNVVRQRDMLFSGHRVLLVTGKTKKDLERKQPYLFLTHALGPDAVSRCTDIETAKSMIENENWGWVYIDDGLSGVASAAAVLFHNKIPIAKTTVKKEAKTKKRKRIESEEVNAEPKEMVISGVISGKKIHVACDEFVIQSLILGALVEE